MAEDMYSQHHALLSHEGHEVPLMHILTVLRPESSSPPLHASLSPGPFTFMLAFPFKVPAFSPLHALPGITEQGLPSQPSAWETVKWLSILRTNTQLLP